MLKKLKAYFKKDKQAKTQVEEISPSEAAKLEKNGSLFVDVRETNEVQSLAYAVKNIKQIPLSQLTSRYNEIPQNKDLIMVCRSGRRSMKAAQFLSGLGYNSIKNLDGGIMKWSSKGFPVKQ